MGGGGALPVTPDGVPYIPDPAGPVGPVGPVGPGIDETVEADVVDEYGAVLDVISIFSNPSR
jgi:hypothetical protein